MKVAEKTGTSLSVQNVSKSYGDVQVLKNICFELEGGKLLTLLGPSGCGKSTLLRIISGFTYADSGDVKLDSKSISHLPPNKRETAMVFQSYTLFPHMSVIDNVSFGLKVRKIPASIAHQKAIEALEMVKMVDYIERYPAQLSGGQMQRVALARAIVTEPRILLLDEPFSALDKNLRDEMQIELRELQRSLGITCVFVTHDQQEAMVISDYVAVMDGGDIAQLGTPLEVYDSPHSKFVAEFIGSSNILFAQALESKNNKILIQVGGGDKFWIDAGTVDIQISTNPQVIQLAIKPSNLMVVDYLADLKTIPFDIQEALVIDGHVENHVLLGDRVSYEVRVQDGCLITAEMERNRGDSIFERGQRVRLVASGASCVALRETDHA